MQAKIKVAFFPYGLTQANPYQNLIIQGLENNGVEVIKVPGIKFFPLLTLKPAQPDIIHVFWPHDLYMGKNIFTRVVKQISLLLTLNILKKYPTVYSAENISAHNPIGMSQATELKWIGKILKRCRGIVFMSDAAKEIFESYYQIQNKKTVIIPHISYKSIYPNQITKVEAKEKMGVSGSFVFLVLGRLQPYKGIEQAIAAFKLLQNQNCKLIIAGKSISSDYFNKLQLEAGELLDGSIILNNSFIPNNEIQQFMNAADCLILNYLDVPLNPGSLVMAKDFNIPVIANNHPVIAETCENLPYYPFESGNISSLLNSMQNALLHKHNNLTVDSTVKDNSPETVGKLLLQYYQHLIL